MWQSLQRIISNLYIHQLLATTVNTAHANFHTDTEIKFGSNYPWGSHPKTFITEAKGCENLLSGNS
jgi:hypothetical protein